jgi:2-polyprenyl-3-methyl-5-hydroxy-6-metoxy-1,4-benzoquinol methylase
MNPKDYPGRKEEIRVYKQHKNDIHDERYQNFVSPITLAVMRDFKTEHRGLDFGAGTGPVITSVLNSSGYQIIPYDPYFHNNGELLNSRYDYIACCEVMEHFHHPYQEFDLLKKLLNPGGKLYCMTMLFDDGIDFEKWYYKNDPTHVFLYSPASLEWIRKYFGFQDVQVEGRLITFTNKD